MTFPDIEIYSPQPGEEVNTLRRILSETMNRKGIVPDWREFHPGHTLLPAYLKRQPGLALAINGHCIDLPPDQAGWPAAIGQAIDTQLHNLDRAARLRRWRQTARMHLSFLLSVFIAIFPKCPFCWAAYLSLLGLAGTRSIPYTPWLLPVAIVLLSVNLLSLYLSRRRHQMAPFWLSVAGALIIIMNRLLLNVPELVYAGSAVLLIASVWNALPRRMAISLKLYLQRLPLFIKSSNNNQS